MLLTLTELRASPIHGFGVFLLAPVKKGELVWRFDSRIDRSYSESEVETFSELQRRFIETYGCWHESTRLWKMCGDNMRFSNHSDEPNLLSAGGAFGDDIAAFDLAPGAELTVQLPCHLRQGSPDRETLNQYVVV